MFTAGGGVRGETRAGGRGRAPNGHKGEARPADGDGPRLALSPAHSRRARPATNVFPATSVQSTRDPRRTSELTVDSSVLRAVSETL